MQFSSFFIDISLQVRNVQASALPYGTSVIVTWRRISYKPPGVSTKYRTSYRYAKLLSSVSVFYKVSDKRIQQRPTLLNPTSLYDGGRGGQAIKTFLFKVVQHCYIYYVTRVWWRCQMF